MTDLLAEIRAKLASELPRARHERALRREFQVAPRSCEVCRWPPQGFPEPRRVLHPHHVIPPEFNGSDHWWNRVVLCPNHHAVAHALFYRQWDTQQAPNRPRSAAHLIASLRAFDALLAEPGLGEEAPPA